MSYYNQIEFCRTWDEAKEVLKEAESKLSDECYQQLVEFAESKKEWML